MWNRRVRTFSWLLSHFRGKQTRKKSYSVSSPPSLAPPCHTVILFHTHCTLNNTDHSYNYFTFCAANYLARAYLLTVSASRSSLIRGWRNCSALKSIRCSFRGLGFSSQHLHGCSQSSVTQLKGIPGSLLTSTSTNIHVVHIHTCGQNTQTHIKINKLFLEIK